LISSTSDVDAAPEPSPVDSSGNYSSAESSTTTQGVKSGCPGQKPTVETVTEEESEFEDEARGCGLEEAEVLFSQQEEELNDIAPSSTSFPRSKRMKSNRETEAANMTSHDVESDNEFASAPPQDSNIAQRPEPMDIDSENEQSSHQVFDSTVSFQHYTIAQLQQLARDTGIDLSNCYERAEIIDLLHQEGIVANDDPEALSPAMFSSWSVSHLQAVASEAKIDLSECATREKMIEKILEEANTERQFLRDYLRSLCPLARKPLSDLRSIARELQVDISDCLEKDEIIQRVISRSTSLGVC